MSFIGRKKEIRRLNELYASKQDVLMLMTGRKYVGMTTLLQAFAEGKNALYFSCSNVSDALNRKAFAGQLNRFCEGEAGLKSRHIPSWKEMLSAYADYPAKKRRLLILDNFDMLIRADRDVLNLLKNSWNNVLQSHGVMVILALHDGQTLMNLKYDGRALLLAVTHHLKIKPVSIMEMIRDYPHHDFNQLMMLYSITGGVPHYFNYFADCIDRGDFYTAIQGFMMNPFGDLLSEPSHLLESEIDNISGYHTVCLALASGRYDLADIAGFCGFKESRTETFLDNLIAYNYVAKKYSVIEKRFGKTPVRYCFKDPLFAFWYTFVFPFYEEIKNGNNKAAMAKLEQHFDVYVRQWFKHTALEIFKKAERSKNIPIQCTQTGTFYNADTEIDVVGIDPDRELLFLGDCCYRDGLYDMSRFDAFREKCNNIKELRQFKNYDRIYGVFSSTPMGKDLVDYAMLNKGVFLFNGITIYSLNS